MSCFNFTPAFTRRDMLRLSANSFGLLALGDLLRAADTPIDSKSPLAIRPTHFAPKAKRIIFLFMHGGPSQVDTFDYKPRLQKEDGKELPFAPAKLVEKATGRKLLASPWKFTKHGESGAWVSELFPNVAKHVDDLCFL